MCVIFCVFFCYVLWIFGIPFWKGLLLKGAPGIPKHQLTLNWRWTVPKKKQISQSSVGISRFEECMEYLPYLEPVCLSSIFGAKTTLQIKVFSNQNRGHLDSGCILPEILW